MPEPSRSELASIIAEAALLRGSFTLRSGKTSSYYLDKYLFTTRPDVLRPLAGMFVRRMREMNIPIDRLAGAELGGIPLVTAASLESGLPAVLVRNKKKDYGTARQVEGKLNVGDRLLLLEDVATTGGQALEAVESLKSVGAVVTGVIAAIDRLQGAREAFERCGIPYESLYTRADLGIADDT